MHSSRTVIQDLYLLRPCLLSTRVCLKLNVRCSMWHGQFIISFERRTDEYTFNLVHSLSSFIMPPPHHPSSPPFDLYKKHTFISLMQLIMRQDNFLLMDHNHYFIIHLMNLHSVFDGGVITSTAHQAWMCATPHLCFCFLNGSVYNLPALPPHCSFCLHITSPDKLEKLQA